MTAPGDKPEPYSSIVVLIVGMAFVLGLEYAPPAPVWLGGGLLGVIGFPALVLAIAKMVLGRMSWTPWRLFRAKQRVGGVFVAFCVWQAAMGASQRSHLECTQATSWHNGDCVVWRRLPGGNVDHVLLFMGLGGYALWRIARLKEPALLECASPTMDKAPDDFE